MSREFPQSVEAEKAVLSSLLLHPIEISGICAATGLHGAAFAMPAHADIYKSVLALGFENKPVDFLTLGQRMQADGCLERCGGPAYLNELFGYVATAANVTHHIGIILDKFRLREIIRVTSQFHELAYAGAESEATASELHREVTALLVTKSHRQSIADCVMEIAREVQNGEQETGLIDYGLPECMKLFKIYRGDLFIITAPTSCGKSALAFQLALLIAKGGGRAALYPLEMKQKNTLKRAIAQIGKHSTNYVRKLVVGYGKDDQNGAYIGGVLKEFIESAAEVKNLPLHLRDDLFTLEKIIADIRAEHVRAPFAFVVVDYLQLIHTDYKAERRQLSLAYISQSIKRLAKELDICICVPSQVNKQGGTREAEDAENDADCLVKIHGEDAEDGKPKPGKVSVWKQREGERHVDLPLAWEGPLTRFDERTFVDLPIPEPKHHPKSSHRK